MTIEHETPSCLGCRIRCGFRQESSSLAEKSANFRSENLAVVVSKVYGFPLMALLAVLLFEDFVFSMDSVGLLFTLLSVLPTSIFLMTRWARKDIGKNRKLKELKDVG